MAAAREWAMRPWYAREWLTWPLAWQCASLVLLILIVVAGARLLPSAWETASVAGAPMVDLTSEAIVALRRAAAAAGAVRAVPRVLLEPIGSFVFAYAAGMGLACASLAAALNRLALSASRR
jgi:hypothetical protein